MTDGGQDEHLHVFLLSLKPSGCVPTTPLLPAACAVLSLYIFFIFLQTFYFKTNKLPFLSELTTFALLFALKRTN